MNSRISINQSQLNNSISKQLYSFNKAQRFVNTIQSPCKERFYNYKFTTLQNRSTSFGYGNKIDLANKEQVPAPGKYQRDSQFLLNRNKKRGYSFSRNSNRSIVNQQQVVKIPGPGKYETDKDIKFSHLKYSFRGKFQTIFEKGSHDLGPGQYKTIQLINKDGHHNIAKYEDSRSRSFTRSSRFDQLRARTPGPGAYKGNDKLSLNKTGTYFNSRFKSNGSNLFARSQRPPLGPTTLSPGPGGYRNFSQFNNTFR